MSAVHLLITLESDVVVSRSSATLGGHKSLDYLPGATLRGAFADFVARENSAWLDAALFSGVVRFGPAYPVAADGTVALPLPRSWHYAKGEPSDVVTDLATGALAAGKQAVQLREGYLAHEHLVTVAKVFSMRTATDREGRASDGLLFGYEAIRAGQAFGARIDVDDPALQTLVERWITAGRIRLGRSRTAEFGTVSMQKVDAPTSAPDHGTAADSKRVVAYCFSDLALRDPNTGAVTLTPNAIHFPGLPSGADFSPESSFLRGRAYSPFNGKRRRPDLERQVIEAGSVIVFTLKQNLDPSELLSKPRSGYGDAVEDGLGQILWNPPFLRPPAKLLIQPARTAAAKKTQTSVELPGDLLGGFVQRQMFAAQRDTEIEAIVTRLGNVLRAFRLPFSQWGVLRDIGRAGGSYATVSEAVRKQTTEGVSGQTIWTRRIGATSAAAELDNELAALAVPLRVDAGVLLERFAARMMRENRGVDRG